MVKALELGGQETQERREELLRQQLRDMRTGDDAVAYFTRSIRMTATPADANATQVEGFGWILGFITSVMTLQTVVLLMVKKFFSWSFAAPTRPRVVLWADDGVRLRRALNALLERAYAKRQVASLQPNGNEPENHVLEVMIPEVACRHLIGARGDRIKLLREESRCEIHMSPGNVAGIAAQRRVKCNGLIPSLAEAVARIHEVLVEFAEIGILSLRHFDLQEVSTGVPTQESSGPKERLLGHGLAGISRREARNARVAVRQLVSAEELALVATREADAEVCRGSPKSVVEIFGAPVSKCICVLQLIVDDFELFPEVQPCTSLLVPASLSTFLAGRLDEAASVGCDARVLTGNNWLILELRGSAQQCLLGAQVVMLLKDLKAKELSYQSQRHSQMQMAS